MVSFFLSILYLSFQLLWHSNHRYANGMSGNRVKDVQKHGGTVLEFLGDGMLAVFGAPNDMPDHAAQAVRCLQTMMHTMERLNETWDDNGGLMAALSKSPFSSKLGFRGGVHTGMVIAGNLGSATQMKYAVVGDTVVSFLPSACA